MVSPGFIRIEFQCQPTYSGLNFGLIRMKSFGLAHPIDWLMKGERGKEDKY
jgi:hypothetical protein